MLPAMVYADSLDFYEVRRMGALTGDNMKTLSRCYLPLIGVEALGVYYALYWDLTVAKSGVETHQSFFRRTLVSSGVFERSLTALEACGLVKTFRRKDEPVSYFVYCVYPPMDAPAFMTDELTSNALREVIGEEAFKRLSGTISNVSLPQDMKEETTDFATFFKPGFQVRVDKKRDEKTIPLNFSKKKFLQECDELGIMPKLLTEDEIDRCAKMATFYELDESTIASFVFESFNPARKEGNRIDFIALKKKAEGSLRFSYMRKEKEAKSDISSTNNMAEKIRLMDEVSPVYFLGLFQGCHRPPEADIKLLERLYVEIGLPIPCINALISFVLDKNNNVLSAPYCEKIAGALVREGCKTARDATDYLYRVNREMNGKKPGFTPKKAQKRVEKEKQEEVSNEEIDALLNEYYADVESDE